MFVKYKFEVRGTPLLQVHTCFYSWATVGLSTGSWFHVSRCFPWIIEYNRYTLARDYQKTFLVNIIGLLGRTDTDRDWKTVVKRKFSVDS